MPPIFRSFPPASFGGVIFPVEDVSVQGGMRDHLHEYPHSDGSAIEKLGRKNYMIRMNANFQATFPRFPGLYPGGLRILMDLLESQTTAGLVIPTIGTMQAYARNWTRSISSRILSGEKVDLEFVEDTSAKFLLNKLIAAQSATFQQKASALEAQKILAALDSDRKSNLFDALQNAVNNVLAIQDLGNAEVQRLETELIAVVDLARQCDQAIGPDPVNARLLDALHDVWDAAQTRTLDLLSQQSPLVTYVVPNLCAVSDIARALYGDASRSVELLDLNAIDDAFAIPAGTNIKFYPDTTAAAA